MWTIEDGCSTISTKDRYIASITGGARGDSKFNAYYQGLNVNPLPPKPDCQGRSVLFGFEILEGAQLWVGMTTQSKFGRGYRCKGLMYGGNLSTGSALLASNWGPTLNTGDKIVFRLEADPNAKPVPVPSVSPEKKKMFSKKKKSLTEIKYTSKILVYVFVNDVALGCAFSADAFLGETIFPLVGFKGNNNESVKLLENIDVISLYNLLTRKMQSNVPGETGVDGTWDIEKIGGCTTLAALPQDVECTVKSAYNPKGEEIMIFQLKMFNTVSTTYYRSLDDGAWTNGGQCSVTELIVPSVAKKQLEADIIIILNTIRDIFRKNGRLVLQSAAGRSAVFLPCKSDIAPPPATPNILIKTY